MDAINIKQLRVIDALIEHKTATKAARVLKISCSVISYTLKQAREFYDDPLFTRDNGFKPTKLALKLQKKFQELQTLSVAKKELIISTPTVVEVILANYIHNTSASNESTLLRFNSLAYSPEERIRNLRNRTIDLDIGSRLPTDSSIISCRLLQSEMCVMASQNHTFIDDSLTMEEWFKCGHLRWFWDPDNLTEMVEGMDLSAPVFAKRRIRYESVNLLSMAYVCARSDFIMLMPKVFIETLSQYYKIKAVTLPEGMSMTFDCYLHYNRAMKDQVKKLALASAFTGASVN